MMGWHVVCTEPRKEGMAEKALKAGRIVGACDDRGLSALAVGDRLTGGQRHMGFEVYAPAYEELVYRGRGDGKRVTVSRLMFPGYLFVRFDHLADPSWGRVLVTPGVRGILTVGDSPAAVPALAMTMIEDEHRRLAGKGPVEEFKPGDRVELADGSFYGHKGCIEKLDGRGRAIVLLSLLGREVRTTSAIGGLRSA